MQKFDVKKTQSPMNKALVAGIMNRVGSASIRTSVLALTAFKWMESTARKDVLKKSKIRREIY